MVNNFVARSGREPGNTPGADALSRTEAGQYYWGMIHSIGLDPKGQPWILEVAEEGVIQFTRRLTKEEIDHLLVPLNPDGSNGILHPQGM